MKIEPFQIAIPQSELDDLLRRLRATRWPDEVEGAGWADGVPTAYLRPLVDHWATAFDWRAHEARLNAQPQFLTEIDGQQIHFVHVRSPRVDAQPIIMTHGWPSTAFDFHAVIGPLTDPDAHGAVGAPAFHVVAPSIPGFGFSSPMRTDGWSIDRVASAWSVLMENLGYADFIAQGGDFGSVISPALARAVPDAVRGVHLNALLNGAGVDRSRPDPLAGLSAADIGAVEETEAWWAQRSGYARLQGTRPDTLAYALTDSPAGLLAWIADLEWAVGDDVLPGEVEVEKEELLAAASIYWFTNTAGTSARIYKEHGDLFGDTPYTATPTAIASFPRDGTRRAIAERHHNVVRFTEYDRGGHFAAVQAPDLLVEDLRQFVLDLGER